MNHIAALPKTGHIAAASLLVFGLTGASAQASSAVERSPEYKAMASTPGKLRRRDRRS